MKLIMRRGLLYPAALGAVVVGVLLWLFGRYDLSVQVESVPPVPAPSPSVAVNIPPKETATAPATPKPSAATTVPATVEGDRSPSAATVNVGKLRVSNQTEHPVRLALRRQLPGKSGNASPSFDEPIHWDFSPQEGGARGLLLALPSGNLQVQVGDVLVAFAQDGSRRYWGPYIVGKTSGLTWNAEIEEWQLVLQK